MRVGIIILNWNGKKLLEKFLPSVVQHSVGHDIYLADNNSTDDSVAFTQKHFSQVQILKMNRNRGYAGGYNRAIKQVENEVLCLLNSDVEVTARWCDRMLDFFNSNVGLGAAQPKILDYNKRDYFEYAGAAGGFLDRFAYPFCRGRVFTTLEKDVGQYDSMINLDWASGACLFVKREAFEKAGGFDNDYFAHQEEIDLCWRLRKSGYSISIEPAVSIFHLGGGTLSSHDPQKTFYNFRNSLFNILKNEDSDYWLVILFVRMLLDGIAAIKFLLEGKWSHFKAIFKAHIDFYRHFSKMKDRRKSFESKQSIGFKKFALFSVVWQYFIRNRRFFSLLSR